MENKRSLVNFAGLLVTFVLAAMSQTAHGVERISYYHNDHLGSPVVATNPQGAVIWRESYQPYGTREHQGGNQNSLWFTGKQEEASFGVSYFGARWYDPEMGRFLAMDPVGISPGDPHSFNRYAYADNNPYRFVDLDGNIGINANDSRTYPVLTNAVRGAEADISSSKGSRFFQLKLSTPIQKIVGKNNGPTIYVKDLRGAGEGGRDLYGKQPYGTDIVWVDKGLVERAQSGNKKRKKF